MLDNLIKSYNKGKTWIEFGWKHQALVMSMGMGLKNSSILLNWMHHVCAGNFSVHVWNVEMVDTSR